MDGYWEMSDLLKKMWAFHQENPHVYELFKRFTLEAIKSGRAHYSVNAIFERIRWYTDIETKNDPFKINNNHRPYYARMFMDQHPEHEGFFRIRRTPSA